MELICHLLLRGIMGCIFRQHKASFMWETQHVLASQDQHINWILFRCSLSCNTVLLSQHFVAQVGLFYFQKAPRRQPTYWHTRGLNESLIGSVWVVTDTLTEWVINPIWWCVCIYSQSWARWTQRLSSFRLNISPQWAALDGPRLQTSSCKLLASQFFSPPCLEVST